MSIFDVGFQCRYLMLANKEGRYPSSNKIKRMVIYGVGYKRRGQTSTESIPLCARLPHVQTEIKEASLLVFGRTGRVGAFAAHERYWMKNLRNALCIVAFSVAIFVALQQITELMESLFDYFKNIISIKILKQNQEAQKITETDEDVETQTHAIGFSIGEEMELDDDYESEE